MKSTISRTLLIALPLAASSLLPSCVSDPYIVSSGQDLPSVRSYTTYSSLPVDYSGDAYFYNDRYYAGGRYEPGTYSYAGRTYDHRYYYDGSYLYGGDYRQQGTTVSLPGTTVRTSTPPSTRYMTYRTLPRGYSGDAYYHNNQYYAGGRYEPGTYSHAGRTYDNRYFHDGKYLYGGNRYQSGVGVSNQTTTQRSAPAYRPR